MRYPVGLVGIVLATLILAGSAQAQTVTIQLSSLNTIIQPHDIKPKNALNKGDYIFFKDLLLNKVPQFGKQKGRPVAYDVGTVTYTSPTARSLTCTVTFPGVGTITYSGAMVDRADGSELYTITGGTGGFKNATGTVTFGKGAKTPPNTFVVTIPGHKLSITSAGGVA